MTVNRKVGVGRSILGALVFIVLGTSTFAQSAQFSGQVIDPQGAAVPKAEVRAVNQATGIERRTVTNNEGFYAIPFLEPGRYKIFVQADGFSTAVTQELTVTVGQMAVTDFQLKVGQASATVTVEGTAPLINTTDGTVSTTIDRNFAENLPLNGRSFQTLILLTPGTVLAAGSNNSGTFSVNGQRANANGFTVDGVSANVAGMLAGGLAAGQLNGANPNFTVAGTTQGMVSVDSLQEFKIQTSTYAAEFGRQPGGQVSLLTRSGTNDFHGTAFDYLRNEFFDATNWFNGYTNIPPIPKGKERQNDFGGTFGGPIFKDKTFFFFSYEGLRLLQPQTQQVQVPSLRLRHEASSVYQAILNSWPIPTLPEGMVPDPVTGIPVPTGAAPYIFSQSFPTNLDSYSIKIDHTLKKRVHFFGKYAHTSSHFTSPNQAPNNNETDKLISRSVTLGTDLGLRTDLENELRLNYSVNASTRAFSLNLIGGAQAFDPSVLYPAPIEAGRDNAVLLINLPNAFFDTEPGPYGKISQRQINLIDNLSYSLGSHQLKWGIDYRRLFPIFGQVPLRPGYFVTSENDLIAGKLSFANVLSEVVAHPIYTNFSAYTQDTWRASKRLTLTYGLRWELNPPPGERDGLQPYNVIGLNHPITATLAPLNSHLYETTYNNFAPRIGVALQLRQTPAGLETVLRGGFGVFYDLSSEAAALGFTNAPFQDQSQPVMSLSFPVANNVLPNPSLLSLPSPPLLVEAIDPKLTLPYTLQWNVGFEQGLGQNQSFTASYVASAGRSLLRSDNLFNFNPNFSLVTVVRNASSSNYQSLQLQFNRRLSHGLQTLVSYTYSHSIDNASDGQLVLSLSPTGTDFLNPNIDRGSSDFDLRHAIRGALAYNLPIWSASFLSRAVLGGWSTDALGIAQTGLPVDLIGGFYALTNYPFGNQITLRPNVVSGQRLYLNGSACAAVNGGTPCPGGRGFNPAAFAPVLTDVNGNPLQFQGTLGRNVMRGFRAWQIDFALHRQFNLTDRVNLQFRSEFFNVFNHPNFAGLDNFVPDGTFGRATSTLNNALSAGIGLNQLYQIGGPRSIQLALKLSF
jgi:hypothetical protein